MSQGNATNLRPWPKGVSGNPGGRPRTARFARTCRQILAQSLPPEYAEQMQLRPDADVSEAIAYHLVRQFLNNNSIPAFREFIKFVGIADVEIAARREARSPTPGAAEAAPAPLRTVEISVERSEKTPDFAENQVPAPRISEANSGIAIAPRPAGSATDKAPVPLRTVEVSVEQSEKTADLPGSQAPAPRIGETNSGMEAPIGETGDNVMR